MRFEALIVCLSEVIRYYGKGKVCPKKWREWLMRSPLPEELLPGSPEDVLEFLSSSVRSVMVD